MLYSSLSLLIGYGLVMISALTCVVLWGRTGFRRFHEVKQYNLEYPEQRISYVKDRYLMIALALTLLQISNALINGGRLLTSFRAQLWVMGAPKPILYTALPSLVFALLANYLFVWALSMDRTKISWRIMVSGSLMWVVIASGWVYSHKAQYDGSAVTSKQQ